MSDGEDSASMRLLEKARTVFDHIIDSLASVSGVIVLGIMFIMTYEVIMRYFFRKAPTWAIEVTEYGLFLLAFLGAAWLLKLGRHIRVDVVVNQLGAKAQTLFSIVTSIVGAIICLVITWFGIDATLDYLHRSVMMERVLVFPKYTLLLFIPLGCFMLAIQFLRQVYGHVKSWRAIAREEPEIAKEKLKIWE